MLGLLTTPFKAFSGISVGGEFGRSKQAGALMMQISFLSSWLQSQPFMGGILSGMNQRNIRATMCPS